MKRRRDTRRRPLVHLLEVDAEPVCGVKRARAVTNDWRAVTCAKCIRSMNRIAWTRLIDRSGDRRLFRGDDVIQG